MTDSNDEWTKARDAAARKYSGSLATDEIILNNLDYQAFKAGANWGYERGTSLLKQCQQGYHDKSRYAFELSQQLEAANAEIAKLKAENWVLNDNNLRTYDGLAQKADKYDEARELLSTISESLITYMKWARNEGSLDSERAAKAAEALALYEKWREENK